MKLDIGGVETIRAPVEALWKALNDPAGADALHPRLQDHDRDRARRLQGRDAAARRGGRRFVRGRDFAVGQGAAEGLQHQGVGRRHARPRQWQRAVRDRAGRSRMRRG